ADAAYGICDGHFRGTDGIGGVGGEDVLATGGGGVAVVNNDEDAIGTVEDGVADAAGEAVVPESAVAHDADGALLGLVSIERGGAGPAEAVAHGGGADVEWRQDGKQVAADVGAHVVRSELALDQFHGAEDRPFRAAGAE